MTYMGVLLGIRLQSRLLQDAEHLLVAVLCIQNRIAGCRLEKQHCCRDFLKIFTLRAHLMISINRSGMRYPQYFQHVWQGMCLQCWQARTMQIMKMLLTNLILALTVAALHT